MDAGAAAGLVFVTVSAAAGTGLALRHRLSEDTLDAASHDVVRLVASFLATLSALVLGLLVASAKTNYDERSSQLHRIAADVVTLDRTLARYGDGARQTRGVLRSALSEALSERVVGDRPSERGLAEPIRDRRLLGLADRIQGLAAQDDAQRATRDRAVQIAEGIATTRVMMIQDPGGAIPIPFLVVLVSWLSAMFLSFGLFARVNVTVGGALLLGAMAVASAVFLILELDRPLDGLMRLSTEPLRHAVETISSPE
jgi:hypothetical protein